MGNHKQTVVFPPFPVELDRKSQALSCDIAASAMLRLCASPLVSVGPAEFPGVNTPDGVRAGIPIQRSALGLFLTLFFLLL